MGQRLNLEIHDNGKVLCNCYYHWGGFTSSALKYASSAIDLFEQLDDNIPSLHKAVLMLYATGAGIYFEDVENFPKNLKLIHAANRNDGLISISEKSIETTRWWEEQRIVLDIGTKTVDIRQLFYVYTPKEFAEEYVDEDGNDGYTLEKIFKVLDDTERFVKLDSEEGLAHIPFESYRITVDDLMKEKISAYLVNDKIYQVVQ